MLGSSLETPKSRKSKHLGKTVFAKEQSNSFLQIKQTLDWNRLLTFLNSYMRLTFYAYNCP